MRALSPPTAPKCSASPLPSWSTTVRSSGTRSPAMARLPKRPRWKRPPSSLVKAMTSSGWRVCTLRSLSVRTTSMAAMTPSAPSYLPPMGTVSMCDPMAMGRKPGSKPARDAMRLPAASKRVAQPASRRRLVTYARASISAGEKAIRSMPRGVSPIVPRVWRVDQRRLPSTATTAAALVSLIETALAGKNSRNGEPPCCVSASQGARSSQTRLSRRILAFPIPGAIPRHRRCSLSVSLSSPATKLYPARNPKGRKFTAEDLWNIARVGKPVPSPKGDWVAVPVTSFDMEKNEGKGRIWRVPADGSAPTPLTASDASAGEPAFSPDGKRLAFTRKTNQADKAQLYVMAVDGGEAERLTDLPLGVFDPHWLADGKRIAFVSPLIAGSLTPEATKKRIEERDKDPVKAHVTEDRVFRFWDRWLTTGESPHIFVVDVETREVRDLTPDSTRWFDFMDGSGQYDVSPDGAEIAFSASASVSPHQLLRWGVFTVPTAGGPTKEVTAGNPADDLRPRYSPDGRYLLYGKQVDPFFYADRVRLIRIDRKNGETKEITGTWDRSPSHWEFLDAQTLVLEVEDKGHVALFTMGIDGGEPRLLVDKGSVGGVTPGSGGRIFFHRQDISSPAELMWIEAKGGTPHALARFNQWFFDEIALGEVQEMEFAGADGKPVQAFIVFPPHFDP